LPVVSNLTAMNMWDGVCMFFIYASFIEFILVNYLARWVQDPEQQKKKKENAILDKFLMANKAFEDKKHEMEATMVNLGDKVGSNITQGLTNLPVAGVISGNRRLDEEDIDAESPVPSIKSTPPIEEKTSWYTLQSVKMIDNYSRTIFPTAYILFVLYFFIRYHAIEGELSIHYYDYFEFE